jgi:hypothetical protein
MMSAAQSYDSLDFSDYLNGTSSQSVTLWQDHSVFRGQIKSGQPKIKIASKSVRKRDSTADDLALVRYSSMAERDLGSRVVAADYPGGKGRDSWRLKLETGQSVIVTRRDNPTRAILEFRVLECLHDGGAPVPNCLAFNGLVLFQEDAGSVRLSDQLALSKDASAYSQTMTRLIDSLFDVYRVADSAGLQTRVPIIGRDSEWVTALIDRTALIGHAVGVVSPRPDVERMEALFQVIDPEFVKWDARAANAVQRDDGSIWWIDWEHCGARHRLDDLAWLLADETVPVFPDAEMTLIGKVLPRYAAGALGAASTEYLFTFGVSHMAVRLARILANKGEESWGDHGPENPTDEERVDLNDALRLCHRAQRWCEHGQAVRVLSNWFKDVAEVLQAQAKA